MVNTGNIKTVDVSVSSLREQAGDGQLVADALAALTQAIADSAKLDATKRDEALEIMSLLATESTAHEEARRSSAMGPLLNRLAEILSGT